MVRQVGKTHHDASSQRGGASGSSKILGPLIYAKTVSTRATEFGTIIQAEQLRVYI